MKKQQPKTETEVVERSNLVIADAITVLDAQGLHDDDVFLSSAEWEVVEDEEDHVLYAKANGVLKLRGSQSEENEHRIKWELTIHARGTQVGYAVIVLRPGDMNGSTTSRMINEAVTVGEEELNKWKDALSEARRALGI